MLLFAAVIRCYSSDHMAFDVTPGGMQNKPIKTGPPRHSFPERIYANP